MRTAMRCDGHVQSCSEGPPGAVVFESALQMYIKIQTTIHDVQCSV